MNQEKLILKRKVFFDLDNMRVSIPITEKQYELFLDTGGNITWRFEMKSKHIK